MSIYSDLRERALKTPDSQFLKVPLVPSLGMVLAAAKATNVFRPGDAVTDYIASYEADYGSSGENIYAHPDLVARFGLQTAYCLAIIADTWSNCLLGVDNWLTSRARNGRANQVGEDLIYFIPDHCPASGYPDTKAECTDEHTQHTRCVTEPFKGYATDWYRLDRDTMMVATRRLPYYAANVAARTDLSTASFLDFSDVMEWEKVPYVPNYSRDGAFTDEERYELLIAVIWRACIAWLLSEEQEDDNSFPMHPDAQAVIISNAIFRHSDIYRHIDKFFDKHPFNRFAIQTDGALLTIATSEGKSSYWYQEMGTDVLIRREGLVLQNGYDQSGLRELLRKLAQKPIKSVEAIPLSKPWNIVV
jgi:hypothetical protein